MEEHTSFPVEEPQEETTAEMQRRIVRKMIKEDERRGLEEREYYYLLTSSWWREWKNAVGYDKYSNREPMGSLPSAIDNSDLFEDVEEDCLKKNLSENYHFVILTKRAWSQFVEWYGGGPAVARKCIRTGWHQNAVLELVPLKVQVIYSRSVKNVTTAYFSKVDTVQDFVDKMYEVLKFNRKRIRVYDFHAGRKHKHLEDWTKRLDQLQILDNQYMLIEEQRKDGKWPSEKLYASFSSSNRAQSYAPSPPGQTGLTNLGNTCFMNSALQCLSATVPLTDYFLSGKYLSEINLDNPLGTKGELVQEFSGLLKQLWSARIGVFTPRDFKFCLGKFAEQFSGHSQHDSQELLAYLLDGLHEDLNRIQKKPYVEILDNWTSEEAWEAHKLRNNSVIVDLFQGQLKSRLRCPNNERISDQYDPFMYLEVPLPVKNSRIIPVTFFPVDPTKPIKKYGVPVPKDGDVRDLKKSLSELTSIPAVNLYVVEVFHSKIYKELKDFSFLSDIKSVDIIVAYELLYDEKQDSDQESEIQETVAKSNEEDVDDETKDESPEIVHIVVMQKKPDRYHDSKLFGDPYVLSVRYDITYSELYKLVVLRLSGGREEGSGGRLKEIPPLDITVRPKYEDENKQEPEEEVPEYLNDDLSMFELASTNTYGTVDSKRRLFNDGRPLNLDNREAITCIWNLKAYKKYFDDSFTPELDESLSEKNESDEIQLADCLRLFNCEEKLSKDDAWYCSECKEHVEAYKKFDIHKAPPILVVHLKRFSYRNKYFRERLNQVVRFPINDFDLTEFVSGPADHTLKYDLYAISNHFGSLGGGHYTAYCRSRNDTNSWLCCDDNSVTPVSTDSIVSQAAYVLFYVRQDVAWPEFEEVESSSETEEESESGEYFRESEEEENSASTKDSSDDEAEFHDNHTGESEDEDGGVDEGSEGGDAAGEGA